MLIDSSHKHEAGHPKVHILRLEPAFARVRRKTTLMIGVLAALGLSLVARPSAAAGVRIALLSDTPRITPHAGTKVAIATASIRRSPPSTARAWISS